MIQNKLHKTFLRLFVIGSFGFLIIAIPSCAPGKTNTAQYIDSLPPPSPPPPPPPPPMEQNETVTLSEATLKKIESTKVLIAAQLAGMSLNGNRENDYLVQVMQLNHSAISGLSSSQLGNAGANAVLNTQAEYFLKATELANQHSGKQTSAETSALSNIVQQKPLEEVKDELLRISTEYKQSGTDPAVLSFATKIIKDNTKENLH